MHPAHATVAADVFVAHGQLRHKAAPSDGSHAGTSSPTCSAPIRPARPSGTPGTTTQHVPDMLLVRRVRRRCRAGGGCPQRRVGPNHLTLYDVATDTVDEAVQRSAATLAEVVAAGRKHPTHTGALTVTLRPTGRHGAAGYRRPGSARC